MLMNSKQQDIRYNSLHNVRFVYLGACLTGLGRYSEDNLVNSIYNRGAYSVLGFTVSVLIDETNFWTEIFMQRIAEGDTIKEAMNAADEAIRNDPDLGDRGEYSVDEENRYFIGTITDAPCG